MNSTDVKEIVKEKYGEIATKSTSSCGCGCGSSNNKIVDYTIMSDDYKNVEGYVADADLNLGCGMPTEYAAIKKGDTVVDLGSGAGNDVFIAHAITGEKGKVIGIDFTPEMIEKANRNNQKLQYSNVEFKLGEIEEMPLNENTADVVVSNCVLNLVPNKQKAFSEIYRILKPGGHFCVSDIVIKGNLPENLKKSAEMYAGCISGAVQHDEYLGIIKETGFRNIEIKKTKTNSIPDDILKNYLNEEQIAELKKNNFGIFSITVYAEK
jgi:ubiquinone/menaquinone biosynthesis C-methylase UbiE